MIFISALAAALIVAVVCIGIFYGTSREALLGPYLYYDIMPKTIYKINGQVYVPLTVDPESGKMADDIPYYIGSVSAEVKEFDFRTVIGPGKAAGKIEDDFLGTKYYDYNSDVYTVQASAEVRDDTELLINGAGNLSCPDRNAVFRSSPDGLGSVCKRTDILFDTKIRQVMGDAYYLLDTNFKNSRYYYAVGNSDSLSWHSFHKHLSFFCADLKQIL